MVESVQRCDLKLGSLVDGYNVDKVLGEGAFGKVFRVTDSKRNVFALKLLKLWEVDPLIRTGLNDRFEMEFQTGRIASPYLVHAYKFGQTSGNPYIIMEYCPNGDLRQYFRNSRADLMRISSEILFGLRDLHSQGKVHRDLKPENVLFKESGMAALTDFGISGDRNKRMTERNIFGRPQQVFGTYAYMPPEQVNRERGNATVLPTTDIFSFGVMMYQVLTGELPFGPLNILNDLPVYQRNAKEERWDMMKLRRCVPTNSMWLKIISNCLKSDYRQRLSSVDEVLSYFPKNVLGSRIVVKDADMTLSRGSVGAPRGVSFKVMQGEDYGMVFYLRSLLPENQHVITVGRDTDNTICLHEEQSSYISRHHCTVESNPDYSKWYIRDGQWLSDEKCWKNSLNGTYLNSKEVTSKGINIQVGDIISIGDVKIKMCD